MTSRTEEIEREHLEIQRQRPVRHCLYHAGGERGVAVPGLARLVSPLR